MGKINSLLLSTITAAFLVGCGGGGGSSSSTTTTSSSSESSSSTSTTEFKLTNAMISGKEIYVTEDNATIQFKSDGTYYELSDSDTCTGTWALNDNGTVTSEQTCKVDNDHVIFTFLSEPKAGSKMKFDVNNGSDTGEVIIARVSDIITVERGPLLGATVKDANGNEAKASNISSNAYTFTTTPVYPITATGGYIDIDANGQITTADVKFTGLLKSYSTVVTPITTYIATGATEADRAAKLVEIKAKIGGTVNDDDLLKKVPSATTADIVVLTNAIYDSYSVLFDTNTANDDVTGVTTLNDKITFYKDVSSSGITLKEFSKNVENKLLDSLNVSRLTSNDVTNYKLTTSLVSNKTLVITDSEGDTTLTFNKNGTYFESGYDTQASTNYSCSGLWRDLGNNKIAFTCDDNGTNVIPDGTVDNLETVIQFTNLNIGTSATVTGDNGDTPITIKSIDTATVSSNKLIVKSIEIK